MSFALAVDLVAALVVKFSWQKTLNEIFSAAQNTNIILHPQLQTTFHIFEILLLNAFAVMMNI